MLLTLTVEPIPPDDPDNWGPDVDEPFDNEWVLHDERGEPIAVQRGHTGMNAAGALQAMADDGRIIRFWTDISPAGPNRWTVVD